MRSATRLIWAARKAGHSRWTPTTRPVNFVGLIVSATAVGYVSLDHDGMCRFTPSLILVDLRKKLQQPFLLLADSAVIPDLAASAAKPAYRGTFVTVARSNILTRNSGSRNVYTVPHLPASGHIQPILNSGRAGCAQGLLLTRQGVQCGILPRGGCGKSSERYSWLACKCKEFPDIDIADIHRSALSHSAYFIDRLARSTPILGRGAHEKPPRFERRMCRQDR
jgi:hypothetical protein